MVDVDGKPRCCATYPCQMFSEKVGVHIAKLLGMPNPGLHTGQCWRGTASTFGTDQGLTEPQLMAVTDHKSTAALKKYTANSVILKGTKAQALSVAGSSNQDHKVNKDRENVGIIKKNKDREITVKKGRGNFEIILNISTITNLKVLQGNDHEEGEESEESDS